MFDRLKSSPKPRMRTNLSLLLFVAAWSNPIINDFVNTWLHRDPEVYDPPLMILLNPRWYVNSGR